MFEPVKKIILLSSLIVGIFLFPTGFAYGQKIEGEMMSASEFARTHGGGEYADVLDGLAKGEIFCGNTETKCSSETQLCLKCSYSVTAGVSTYTHETGICVSKNGFDKNNPRKSWTGGNCPETSSTYCAGTAGSCTTTTAGNISVENYGFLANNSTTVLFWSWDQEHEFSAEGHKYRLVVGKTPKIVYGDKDNAHDGCEVLPVKLYNMQGCFFCPLAGLIFDTANIVTIHAFETFGQSFRVVIAMVFGIWLALAALGQVFPMTKQDAPKFFAAILKQGFKFMVAYFLLLYSADLFKYFIIPLLDGGMQLGHKIQQVSLPTPDPDKYMQTEIFSPETHYNIKPKDGGDGLYEKIENYLASLQMQLAYMQAIGTTVFCVGSHKITLWKLITSLSEFKAGLRMMMLGGILTSFSFLLTIAFAFYFLDAILQLAVIGVMMPLMIAGWPFRATAQYASTGFKMLLNSFFVLFFTGFVVRVNVNLLDQSLALSQATGDEAPTSGFEAIAEAINNQDWGKLNEATDIGGAGFLILAFCCIFGFKFVAQVTPLASKLSAGGFSKGGIAGKIGTMAASATKGMAAKASAPVGRALGGAAADAAVGIVGMPSKVLGGIGEGMQRAGNALSEKGYGKIGAAMKGVGAVSKGIGKVGSIPHKAVKAVRDEAKSKQ